MISVSEKNKWNHPPLTFFFSVFPIHRRSPHFIMQAAWCYLTECAICSTQLQSPSHYSHTGGNLTPLLSSTVKQRGNDNAPVWREGERKDAWDGRLDLCCVTLMYRHSYGTAAWQSGELTQITFVVKESNLIDNSFFSRFKHKPGAYNSLYLNLIWHHQKHPNSVFRDQQRHLLHKVHSTFCKGIY